MGTRGTAGHRGWIEKGPGDWLDVISPLDPSSKAGLRLQLASS